MIPVVTVICMEQLCQSRNIFSQNTDCQCWTG